MKPLLIIAAVLFIATAFDACTSGDKLAQDPTRPTDTKKPTTEIVNDKIIVISNVSHDDISKALSEFCNIYNKDIYAVLPRLWLLSSSSFAVTFPYNTDFASFCFAVNFLKYPIDLKWHARVRGWATTKQGDDWITDKSINKKVMLYLSVDDKEYDNVLLTTRDNIGYKLGFAAGHEKQLLDSPKEVYAAPTVDVVNLTTQKHEDYK